MNNQNISHNPVSADTLFHFTGKEKGKENLLSILENGFYPRYCLEDTTAYIDDGSALAFPIVCFCDIPLTRIKTHTEHYGEYSIGLEKNWGIRNGIAPILYVHPTSLIFGYISESHLLVSKIIDEMKKVSLDDKENPLIPVIQNLSNTLAYIKSHEGRQWKNNKWGEEIINFYNEREWRYIPLFGNGEKLESILHKNRYDDKFFLEELNLILKEKKKLIFEPQDIKFIIVADDEEIPEMVDKVEEIMKNKYNLNDREIKMLITKIISMQQIRNNF